MLSFKKLDIHPAITETQLSRPAVWQMRMERCPNLRFQVTQAVLAALTKAAILPISLRKPPSASGMLVCVSESTAHG